MHHFKQLKKELPSILIISVLQIWWHFNFPLFERLGVPWNYLVSGFMSVASTGVVLFLFYFMDDFAPYLILEHINDSPFSSISKKINIAVQLVVAFFSLFVIWYTDFYCMSNFQYSLFFTSWFVMLVLIYRAAWDRRK